MKRRAEIIIAITLIILGVSLAAYSLASANFRTISGNEIIPPEGNLKVPYPADSQVILSLNTTEPINVSGIPHNGESDNDSVNYVFCFFSSEDGTAEIHNDANISATVFYNLEYSTSSSVGKEFLLIGGVVFTALGVILAIVTYAKGRSP